MTVTPGWDWGFRLSWVSRCSCSRRADARWSPHVRCLSPLGSGIKPEGSFHMGFWAVWYPAPACGGERKNIHMEALHLCKIIWSFLSFKVLVCPFSLRAEEGKGRGAGTCRAVFPVLGPHLEMEKWRVGVKWWLDLWSVWFNKQLMWIAIT